MRYIPVDDDDRSDFDSQAVCPWCKQIIDTTDFRGTCEVWNCPTCNELVEIEADYEATYSTRKMKVKR